jgi:hypothetical protein
MRDAEVYAARILHSAPPVPRAATQAPVEAVEVPAAPAPAIIVPKKPVSATAPSAAIEPSNPQYRYAMEFIHVQTGEQRTETLTFGPDEVAEASLDPLGPSGPRGRAIASRMGETRMKGTGFVFAGKPTSLRLDMGHLMQSMGA